MAYKKILIQFIIMACIPNLALAQIIISCQPAILTTSVVSPIGVSSSSTSASAVPPTYIFFNENEVLDVQDNVCGSIQAQSVSWREIEIYCTASYNCAIQIRYLVDRGSGNYSATSVESVGNNLTTTSIFQGSCSLYEGRRF